MEILQRNVGTDLEVELFKVWRPGTGRSGRIKGKMAIVIEEGGNLLRMLLSRRCYQTDIDLVADYAHYSTLIIAKWMSLFGIRKKVYLYNFYVHKLGHSYLLQRLLKFLMSSQHGLTVQSQVEYTYFKSIVPDVYLQYAPYCRAPITAVDTTCVRMGGYVFSGGYTNRDYDTLISCARRMPDTEFVIACSRLNRFSSDVPGNVQVHRDILLRDFHNLLAGCSIVVVPLKEDVGASGQMVVLAGMQFSKPIIYTDFDVVSQYFPEEGGGLSFSAGDTYGLVEVLGALVLDEQRIFDMGRKARQFWEVNFKPESFSKAIGCHMSEFFLTND